MTTIIPCDLLVAFLETAAKDLSKLVYDGNPQSLHQHRVNILRTQQATLSRIVSQQPESEGRRNLEEQIQTQLQHLERHPDYDKALKQPSQRLTQMARNALSRLVVQQEMQHPTTSPLTNVSHMTRKDALEFCGLCQATLNSPEIATFLSSGGQTTLILYETSMKNKKLLTPIERWMYLQGLLWQALGFPDIRNANEQIQKLVDGDDELGPIFQDTLSKLQMTLDLANVQMQQNQFQDFEEGGVTRVLSVTHSESESPNHPMERGSQVSSRDAIHRQSAALEQSMLAYLLQMDPEERDEMLEEAHIAQDQLERDWTLHELNTATERAKYMTQSLSPDTQQLLLMKRLWEGLLQRNQGQPPRMASTSEKDY